MLVEISVVPVGAGESVSGAVAEVIDIIDSSGVDYILTPMGTVIEGDWDKTMKLVKQCHQKVRESHNRVITSIKIDDREGTEKQLQRKVEVVEGKIGRRISRT